MRPLQASEPEPTVWCCLFSVLRNQESTIRSNFSRTNGHPKLTSWGWIYIIYFMQYERNWGLALMVFVFHYFLYR